MRFPMKFSRWKGGGGPAGSVALGSDAVPTRAIASTGGVGMPAKTTDNVLVHRFSNVMGWPAHRVAIVYDGHNVVAPVSLNLAAYVYDANTDRWYRMHSAATITLPEGIVTYVDTISLVEQSPTTGIPDNSGSEQMMFIITDPGAAPNGEHIFACGPDLTTIGY